MRGLRRWLAPFVVFLAILAMAPYGAFLGDALYRLGPPGVLGEVVLGEPLAQLEGGAQALAVTETGRVARLDAEGSVQWREGLAGRCQDVRMVGPVAICAAGAEGLLLFEPAGEGAGQAFPHPDGAGVVAVDFAGHAVVAGLDDGRLAVADLQGGEVAWRGAIAIAEGPVDAVRIMEGAAAVASDGSAALQIVTFASKDRPIHARSLELPGPARDLDRFGGTLFVAAGEGGVVVFDLRDLEAPLRLAHLEVGEARRVKLQHGRLVYAVVADRGLVPVGRGPLGWGAGRPRGVEAEARLVTGGPPLQPVYLPPDRIAFIDGTASRDVVIWGVGAAGGVVVLGLLGGFLVWRPARWPSRLAWAVLGLLLFGLLLRDRFHRPIEALHLLEYGMLGALIYGALRPGGGGLRTGIFALLLSGLGALFDETFQWFLPSRTGDLDDVVLDMQAAAIGVLVGGRALWPRAAADRSWSPAWIAGALGVVWVAAFQHLSLGFGGTYEGPEGIRFHSRLDPEEIRRLDEERGPEHARLLNRASAMGYGEFLQVYDPWREPFLYELRVHVYRRDRRLEKGDVAVACGEQRFIEHWYRRSIEGTIYEWAPSMRALCDPHEGPYDSPVSEELLGWPGPTGMWGGVVAVVGLALGAAGVSGRRRSGAPTSPGDGGSRAR